MNNLDKKISMQLRYKEEYGKNLRRLIFLMHKKYLKITLIYLKYKKFTLKDFRKRQVRSLFFKQSKRKETRRCQ